MVAASVVACGKSDKSPGAGSVGSGAPSPSSKDIDGIKIPDGLSSAHRAAAEKAKQSFVAACAVAIDWNEFKEVSLTTSTASGYLRDSFDWDLIVTIALVYKDGLDQRRGGHRLTFDMGAGNRPGIVTRKSHAIQLCGFGGKARSVGSDKPCDPEAGEDCILDVAALKALDAARPAAVVESSRTAPPAWCFAHGFDPPTSWSCVTTEAKCKTARAAKKRDENGDYKVRTECTKAEALHCFKAESGRTVCAPNAAACTTSRREWTNLATATPCEVATVQMLDESNKKDD